MISNDTLSLAQAEPRHTAHAAWPRAVMATLLVMIATLTVHLVDITWFDGTDSAAIVADAGAPYQVSTNR